MKYDITVEPWIPVLMLSGERKKLSLLELLQSAHEIQQLDGMNVMEEYSVYRFLTLFLMAVYYPEDIDDIEDILDEKHVDMDKVNRYITTCRQEGVSFDIFDKKRPFLQSPYDPKYDTGKINSISVLDKTMPSGNNPIHFDHTLEKNAVMTFDKAVRNLLAAQIFSVAAAQGYPSNVNGAPPIFFIPKGKNLFYTLILSLCPIKNKGKIADKHDLELWRNNRTVVPKENVTKASVFYGMLFPSRRICLIKENDDLLTKCYFQQGLDFIGYDSWTDFYAAYYWDDKGRHSLKPSLSKELWRNIGTIYGLVYSDAHDNNTISVVGQFEKILDDNEETEMPLISFGAVTNQASYLDLQRGELMLNTRIAEQAEKVSLIKNSIEKAESIASCLKKSMEELARTFADRKDYRKSYIDQTIHDYYGSCETCFYIFSDELSEADDNETKQGSFEKWLNNIKYNGMKSFNQFCDDICSTSKDLMVAEKIRINLLTKIKKIAERS